jgi:hypothetical protein
MSSHRTRAPLPALRRGALPVGVRGRGPGGGRDPRGVGRLLVISVQADITMMYCDAPIYSQPMYSCSTHVL